MNTDALLSRNQKRTKSSICERNGQDFASNCIKMFDGIFVRCAQLFGMIAKSKMK